ncbi:hypothetical protein U1Q18_048678, partial [Sarracenia purpurea var. burkii]
EDFVSLTSTVTCFDFGGCLNDQTRSTPHLLSSSLIWPCLPRRLLAAHPQPCRRSSQASFDHRRRLRQPLQPGEFRLSSSHAPLPGPLDAPALPALCTTAAPLSSAVELPLRGPLRVASVAPSRPRRTTAPPRAAPLLRATHPPSHPLRICAVAHCTPRPHLRNISGDATAPPQIAAAIYFPKPRAAPSPTQSCYLLHQTLLP